MNNDGSDYVFVVEMHNGVVNSVTHENRATYENTKGVYIMVRHYGNLYLLTTPNGSRVAVKEYIKWRRPKTPLTDLTVVNAALDAFFRSI